MPDTTTLGETTRVVDGTEFVRLATTGANWKATLASIFSTLGNPTVVPGGANTDVQFNNGVGGFGGDGSFTYAGNGAVTIGSSGHTGALTFVASDTTTVTVEPQTGTTPWTLKWPKTAGTNTYVLTTDGSGVTSWAAQSGGVTVAPNPQWNPVEKGPHITLSGGNSTATNDGTAHIGAVLDVAAHSGGKWYAECKVGLLETVGNSAFGIGNIYSPLNNFPGIDANSWGYFPGYGFLYHNNMNGPAATQPTTGDILQIAWDGDTGNLFFGLNNVWQNASDPVAETNPCFTGVFGGVNQQLYLICSTYFDGTHASQWVFQNLVYTPPQGYSPWSLSSTTFQANSINVPANDAYYYDGNVILFAQTALNNFYDGGAGNFTGTGTNNTGEGIGTLGDVTTASSNTAFGTHSLGLNITGGGNLSFGTNALHLATNPTNCIAMGEATMGITAGNVNKCIAIGSSAMTSVTGDSNIAIGYFAGNGISSGIGNLFIGELAGTTSVGTQNIIVGYQGMETGGDQNTGVGYQVLTGTSTANRNTALGFSSGFNITTGNNNVLLGFNDQIIVDVTSGSGNVQIGYKVAVPSATASNQLCISNMIYGTGLSGTGATPSTGKIGIGLVAPAFTLDVFGGIQGSDAAAFIHCATTLTGGGIGNIPTLTSGPVTGNPTKWIPIDDAGVTRYVPAW